jgi:hypothetical protein
VTVALIVAISTVSLVGYAHPQVLEALEPRRGELGDGQWWRLVSPLLVQTDGWKALLAGICAGFVALAPDPALPLHRGGAIGFDELAALGGRTAEVAHGPR